MPSINAAVGRRDSRTDESMLIDVASLSRIDQTDTTADKAKYDRPAPKIDSNEQVETSRMAPKSILLHRPAPQHKHQRQVSLPHIPPTPTTERELSWSAGHHRRASSASSSASTSLLLSMTYDDEAIEELWENLRKRRQILGSSHPKVGRSYNHIGNCHFRRNEMDAALSAYKEALKVYKQSCENIHDEIDENLEQSASSLGSETSTESVSYPVLALCMCNIGTVQWRIGHLTEAIKSLEESVRIYCRFCAAAGQSTSHLAELSTAWYNLGLAYCLRANYGEALEAFEMARKGFASSHGVDSVEVARVMDAVGKVSLLRGSIDKAIACHRMALKMKMSELGHSHPSVLCSMMSVAGAQRAKSELDEARSMYHEVLRVQKSILSQARQVSGNGSWSRSVLVDVAQTLHFLGLVNEEMGDSTHAIKCYTEGLEAFEEADIAQDDDRVVLLRNRCSAQIKRKGKSILLC